MRPHRHEAGVLAQRGDEEQEGEDAPGSQHDALADLEAAVGRKALLRVQPRHRLQERPLHRQGGQVWQGAGPSMLCATWLACGCCSLSSCISCARLRLGARHEPPSLCGRRGSPKAVRSAAARAAAHADPEGAVGEECGAGKRVALDQLRGQASWGAAHGASLRCKGAGSSASCVTAVHCRARGRVECAQRRHATSLALATAGSCIWRGGASLQLAWRRARSPRTRRRPSAQSRRTRRRSLRPLRQTPCWTTARPHSSGRKWSCQRPAGRGAPAVHRRGEQGAGESASARQQRAQQRGSRTPSGACH